MHLRQGSAWHSAWLCFLNVDFGSEKDFCVRFTCSYWNERVEWVQFRVGWGFFFGLCLPMCVYLCCNVKCEYAIFCTGGSGSCVVIHIQCAFSTCESKGWSGWWNCCWICVWKARDWCYSLFCSRWCESEERFSLILVRG